MLCMKCGKQCDDNQKYCMGCGNPLVTPQTNNIVQNSGSVPVTQPPIVPMVQPTNVQPIYNQPVKQKKKGFGCLIFFLILIFLIIGIIIFFSLVFKTDNKSKTIVNKFSKDYDYLSLVNKEEVMIKNAKEDITFYVTSNAKYTLVDSKGKIVATEIKNNQIVNNNKYEKGETYTLTLKSGKFVSNQLASVKKVTFKIARSEVKEYKYKDTLIEVKPSDIKVSKNETTLTSSKNYKIGDVIAISDEDIISKAYVITANNKGVYKIRKAKLNEIYSELNFYVEEPANLSNYEVSKQIEEYVAQSIVKSAWYTSLVKEVESEPKLKVELSEIENGIEAKATVTIDANESSPLVVTKYHDLELSITNRLMINQLIDITLTNWDVSFDITTEQDFEFNIVNDKLEYGKTFSEKEVNRELVKKVKKALESSQYTDVSNKKVPVTTIDIPTAVPCLTVEVDLKLSSELNASIELDLKTSQSTNIVVGFDYGVNEKFKPISSYNYDFKGVEISLTGKAEYKAGLEISVTAEILNTVEAGINLGAGLYAEGETGITTNIGKESQFGVSLGYDIGMYLEGNLVAEFLNTKVEYHLFEKKFSLDSKKVEFVYPKAEGEEEQKLIDENGMIVNKEENRLEQYSCVSSTEDESFAKATYLYKNNKFAGVKVTEVIYINTGVEWIDNLLKIILKVFSVYRFFETWAPIEYYEDGYYVYFTTTYTPKKWVEINSNKSKEDISYNDFKVEMVENGYTCK